MNYIINKKVHGCNYWMNFYTNSIFWEGLRENAHVFSNFSIAKSQWQRAINIGNVNAELQYENGTKVEINPDEKILIEQELQPNYGYNANTEKMLEMIRGSIKNKSEIQKDFERAALPSFVFNNLK